MTRDEFAPMVGLMAAATHAEVTRETVEVYFDLLNDLPANLVRAAIRQAVLEQDYPTLPPVGKIRKLAVSFAGPPAIPGPEAWNLFLAAVRRFGSGRRRRLVKGELIEFDASEQGLATLPPVVAHAARCFGWQRLCDTSAEHMGIAERDFLQSYGTLEKRDEQQAIMPPSVRAIANHAGDAFVLDESTTRGPRELAAYILQQGRKL